MGYVILEYVIPLSHHCQNWPNVYLSLWAYVMMEGVILLSRHEMVTYATINVLPVNIIFFSHYRGVCYGQYQWLLMNVRSLCARSLEKE